jgi:hypothetical protein
LDAVLSLNWKSAYQSVRGLVQHLAASWRQSGLNLVELDIAVPGWESQLKTLLNTHRIRFVLCTSGIGANIRLDNENLWTKLQIPVFSLLLDHPAYLADNHTGQSETTVLGYMFRDHALYQASDVRATNIVTSIDYGIPNLPTRPINELAPGCRIIFAKTGNDPAALAATWREAPLLERILHDVLDELALDKTGAANVGTFQPLIGRVAAAHRIELKPFDLLSRFLIAQIDDVLRRRKSTAIAHALLPFEVDVYGAAWDHIDTTNARAKFHGPADYTAVEAAFPAATASLTMNPNIDLSAHDRFFTALGAGIMPITDRNSYIAETFPELLPYTFDFTPGSIEAALEKLTRDPQTALEVARATRTRTRPIAGVEQAATAILETMQAANFLHASPKHAQNFFVP